MVWRWRGTSFLWASSASGPSPTRASIQSIRAPVFMGGLCFGDYNVVSVSVDHVFFKGPGRRPANILAVEVVLSIMTGTPNLFFFRAVLHNAFQVGADGRKRPEVARLCPDQYARFVAELEDLAGIDRQLAHLAGANRVLGSFDGFRRRHESEDRIEDCDKGGAGAGCQQEVEEAAPAVWVIRRLTELVV